MEGIDLGGFTACVNSRTTQNVFSILFSRDCPCVLCVVYVCVRACVRACVLQSARYKASMRLGE